MTAHYSLVAQDEPNAGRFVDERKYCRISSPVSSSDPLNPDIKQSHLEKTSRASNASSSVRFSTRLDSTREGRCAMGASRVHAVCATRVDSVVGKAEKGTLFSVH